MKHTSFLALCLALITAPLAGCDSPSPRMMGAAHETVTVEGSTFGVHWTGTEAEIYRTSFEALPRLSVTMAKAERAVVLATGCKVVAGSLRGDAALMTAKIDCG